jgi:hypothetical protein
VTADNASRAFGAANPRTWLEMGFGMAFRSQLPPKQVLYTLYAPCNKYARYWLCPALALIGPSRHVMQWSWIKPPA